jgi:hypothetical protein
LILSQSTVQTPQTVPNTFGSIPVLGGGAIHNRGANHLSSGINAMDQVAGNARVAKNRSNMTQDEINRRCGVAKAMGDRERLARQILEERKSRAEAEIRELEEKMKERQLDIEAIDARLAGREMSSAVVEGILQSQEAEENAKNNQGKANTAILG